VVNLDGDEKKSLDLLSLGRAASPTAHPPRDNTELGGAWRSTIRKAG